MTGVGEGRPTYLRQSGKELPIARDQGSSTRTAHQRLRRVDRRTRPPAGESHHAFDNLIVIGTSAGGINALASILETIPADIPAAIVIVIHQRQDSVYQVAGALRRLTHLPVVAAKEGARLRNGTIYVPSAGSSLQFRRHEISDTESVEETQFTSINRMFSAAAKAYGNRVMGVILTGLLKDGTEGMRRVHDAGGLTIVQNPAGAEYPAMPLSAMRDLPVTFCLDLEDIGVALDLLARRSSRLETGIAVSIRMLKKRVELLVRLQAQSGGNVGSSDFLGEELVELNRDLESITQLIRPATRKARR